MSLYQIEQMTLQEVSIAVEWAKNEGWNPGINDAECFYQTDPQGFFAGKLNGKIIATGSAVVYDEHFAFCGFYIVDEHYRSQGYGMELTKARLAYIGSRNAGIDGVLEMVDNYSKIGYKFAHSNARYALKNKLLAVELNPHVLALTKIPFHQVVAYDQRHFPAARPQFLKIWIQQQSALSLGYVEDNQLKGYGIIRKCFEGYKIGPLFADTSLIAQNLFAQLVKYAHPETVYLDIPENNPLAVELVSQFGMIKIFTAARMYLKDEPILPINEIYGITTFELG